MTSTQPLEPRVIEPFINQHRTGNVVDSNTFKGNMLWSAQNLAINLFHRALSPNWRGEPLQINQELLFDQEQDVLELRGGLLAVEDTLAPLDSPGDRAAALGSWTGHDLYLLVLRDLVESGEHSIYNRHVHNTVMHAVEDAVELLARTYLFGKVKMIFPDWASGLALGRLLANWAPFPRVTLERRGIIYFRGKIEWNQRMAYDAAARRCEDELMRAGFQGHISIYMTGAIVMHSVARWHENAYMALVSASFGDGSPFRGLILDKAVEDHFQLLLAEELARPIEYTPKAE